MSNAQDYRTHAAELTRLASEATSVKEMKKFHQRARSLSALAENEEWAAANGDKIISNRAAVSGRIGHALPDTHE